MTDDYTKKLEEENAILNKKVMDYEDIIKKLDPTFFEIKGVVDENIEEEKEGLQKYLDEKYNSQIKEYWEKRANRNYPQTAEEKLDDEISKAIKNDRNRGFF